MGAKRVILIFAYLIGVYCHAQTVPPYATDFEAADGFTLGNLAAQNGWSVPAGSAVITNDTARSGAFSVGLLTGSGPTEISHLFAPLSGAIVTYIDFYAKPSAGVTVADTTTATAEGASLSVVRVDSTGHILVFDGNGTGGGRWVVTGRNVALNGSGQAVAWVRFTIRQDYSTKKWDLYVDGQMAMPDLGFRDNTKTYFSQFSLASASLATGYFDYFYAGSVNPLFTDQDNDGMDDTWESAHGLNPALNDRNGDLDGDGLTNIEEYSLGTNPNAADTDGDGIPDGWEAAHGTNPLVNDAATDPGGVGRTLLQSYQQSLSPWPTPVVATGLQAWFRADNGVLKDANNKVSKWTDVSGHGVDAIQTAITSRQPLWVSSAMYGQPAVAFDGTTLLKTSGVVDVQGGSSDLTVITVTLAGATQMAYGSLVDMSSDTAQGFVVGQVGGNTNQEQLWFRDAAQSGWYSSPAATLSTGQVQVLSVVKNGANASAYLNGTAQGTGTVPAAMLTPLTALALGSRASGNYSYNGQIAEVLIYNRALTDTERGQIEASLQTKYVNPDGNGNGLPDAWEQNYLGTLSYPSSADPGGVGRTLLQSYQQGLSPWPAPTVTSGLRAWYRADLGVTKDGTNLISSWVDLSGQGGHVIQTGARQPTWVASAMFTHPAVQFDGTTFLKTSAAMDELAGSSDVTVIAVATAGSTQQPYSSLVDLSSDTARGFVLGQLGSNTNQYQLWFMDAAQSGWYASPPASAIAGQVAVISTVKQGATATSYLNGTAQGGTTVPAALLTPTAALAIGNRASGNYGFTGQISEVLIYNRALSNAERAQIEVSLQTKYINLDLDGDGLPDVWEQKYLGTLSYGPNDDPGGVGRTLLQSYQQGLSPWPAATVSSGLQAWYRADLGMTKDANNVVSSWVDLSGQGSHVTQAGTRQPTWVASAMFTHPAVQFDGSTFLKTAGSVDPQTGSTDVTVITVALPAATQPAYASLVDLSSDTSHGFVVGQLGGSTNQFQLWFMNPADSGWYSSPAAGTTAGQVQVLSVVKNGANASAYLNGTAQGSATVPTAMVAPVAALAVGNRGSGSYGYNGQIAEVLVYNRALTDPERAQIEQQLLTRYVNPDGNGNGLPDAWEQKYLGTLTYGANADPGSVGRTLLQSYQQGLSPWPTATVGSGLQAWYRADLGITKDAANKVSQWTDVSGNGFHVVQAGDPTKQPLWVSGTTTTQPTLSFDGTTLLKTGAAADVQAGSSDLTVIVVTSAGATQMAYGSLVDLSSDTAQGFVVGQVGGNTNQEQLWFRDAAQSGWYSSPAATLSTGQTQVLTVVKNGVSASAYLNGTAQGSGTVPAAMLTPLTALALGSRASGNYSYNGQIAEVLVYNRALSDTERTQVEAALNTKYSSGSGSPGGGTDPNDFFSGEKPVLIAVSGEQQPRSSGFLPQPVVVQVFHADGSTPWPNALVTFQVMEGDGQWAATLGGPTSTTLQLHADALGQVKAYYWLP